jgi:hypothetical protein
MAVPGTNFIDSGNKYFAYINYISDQYDRRIHYAPAMLIPGSRSITYSGFSYDVLGARF